MFLFLKKLYNQSFENDDIYSSIEKYSFTQKMKKYGDPRRNLFITFIIITLLAVLAFSLYKKTTNNGITSKYANKYPVNTAFYIDVNLNKKHLKQIDESLNVKINSLSDFLCRIYNLPYRNSKILSEILGETAAFGTWEDSSNKRSLLIINIKREGKINSLYKAIVGKQKLVNKVYNGYKIVTTGKKAPAFFLNRNQLYIGNDINTIKVIIDKFFIRNDKNFYSMKDTGKALSHLEQERIGTLIFNNFSDKYSKIQNKISALPFNNAPNIKEILKITSITAGSISTKSANVNIELFTPYNISKIESESLKQSFLDVFNSKGEKLSDDIMPVNTVGYLSISEFKTYLYLLLDLYGIKSGQDFEQTKEFVLTLTSLDFEKDIMQLFTENTTLLAVNSEKKTNYALILPLERQTESTVAKLIKVLESQSSNIETKNVVYKDIELGIIKSSTVPELYFGKLNKDFYILGEKNAVESVISGIKENKDSLIKSYSFNKINNLNSKISGYLDFKKIKPEVNYNGVNKKQFKKYENMIDSAIFNINYSDNAIKSSLKIKLKK